MTSADVQRGPLWGRTTASQQRRRDILLAGKTVFFESGYQLASVDRIAEVAATTKRTVYDHFGSKEALFGEVISFACSQFVGLLPEPDALPEDPKAGILLFATRICDLVGSPDIVRFQRLVIAEAQRHPLLGRALYETAVLGAEQILEVYLLDCIARAQLKTHDTKVVAQLILDTATNTSRLCGLLAFDGVVETAIDRSSLVFLVDLLIASLRPELR